MLKEEKIDCVIVSEDAMPFNKTVVSAARSIGIDTIVLQKGLCAHNISFVPVTADKFAAWGKAAKDYLTGQGVEEHRIEVIGSIRFQDYKKDVSLRGEVCRDLGIQDKYDKVFLATPQHDY